MNEQRRQVLEMLAEGKITADEAERLIDALEGGRSETPGGAARAKPRPKYLRVEVSDASDEGPSWVNVRVPLQLLRAGVKLTSLIPPQALGMLNTQLEKSGVPIDLTRLKPEHIEELVDQLDDFAVNLEETQATMRIYCE